MVMKEADTVKVCVCVCVSGTGLGAQVLRVLHKGGPLSWGRVPLPTEQREAGEAAPGRRAVLHQAGPLPHALRLDRCAPSQHRQQRRATGPGFRL